MHHEGALRRSLHLVGDVESACVGVDGEEAACSADDAVRHRGVLAIVVIGGFHREEQLSDGGIAVQLDFFVVLGVGDARSAVVLIQHVHSDGGCACVLASIPPLWVVLCEHGEYVLLLPLTIQLLIDLWWRGGKFWKSSARLRHCVLILRGFENSQVD